MTDPVTPSDYRALAAFGRAVRAFLHFSEEAARAEGLTPTQHQQLMRFREEAIVHLDSLGPPER